MSKSRSGAPRRIAAGLLAGALSVVGIALAPPAGAVDDVNADRLAGINRYGTAAAIAGQDDFDGATTAILATGETFPDALAASGLAGSNAPAPIILTESETFSDEAQEALTNLTSITDVVIVGGTAAVSQDVEDDVEAAGFTVSRVAGADRYETAAAIAGEIGTIGEVDGLVTAFVATGTGFADALAGGPAAYDLSSPILLVTPTEVPAATSAAIADLGIEQVIVLGGTAAVSDDVVAELEDATGNPAVRAAGENRFGTAAAVGEWEVDALGWAPAEVLLASGLNFPDALAGGPLGGERDAPVLLTASLPEETQGFLDDHSDTITQITALGGTGVIDEETLNDAEDAAEETANDDDTPTNATATTRPELVSASIVETRTASTETNLRPRGTYVLYCFDEAITGLSPVAANLHLYNASGVRYTASASGAATGGAFTSPAPTVSGTDNKCVEAHFGVAGQLDTAALASTLTLATANNGAVFGQAGASDPNIEGDAPLTPAGSTAAAAGTTSNPDLVSVGNFRAGVTADLTAVDFTFDAAAFVNNTNGYHLVTTTGGQVQCSGPIEDDTDPSGGTVGGGEGTTVHTVVCEEPVGGATFSETSIVRGFVVADAVDATDTFATPGNPLQAADVGTGASDGPDLVSAIFSPDAITGVDVVAYLFDENVSPSVGGVASFAVYSSTGAETNAFAAGGGCSRSTENNSVVTCVFSDGALTSSTVGANVKTGAVTDLQGIPGRGDEVGVSPVTGSASGAGLTDGPDLTGVTINSVTSAFGTPGFTVTYTFDEDTADGFSASTADNAATGDNSTGENVVASLFHLYTADGIDLVCAGFSSISSATALTNRTEDQDNTVTCTSYTVSAVGGTAATTAQVGNGVVGTVDFGAADDEAAGGDTSPEGAAIASGGTGTPAS